MIITTPQGAKFDTSKPAKSNIITTLDANGRQVMDSLTLTGRFTIVEEFNEKKAMIEVSHSFGIDEVNEDFLWQ